MTPEYLQRPGNPMLAYHYTPVQEKGLDLPPVMFLGGYRSDMNGTKATYFEAQCRARGQAYMRFDYRGHGLSGGAFENGTIGAWKDDALAILDHVAADDKKTLLVGSSMGGWIALLVARERPGLMHGLVGIAAAPDFTEEIYNERLNDTQRETLMRDGLVYVPNDYSDEPYVYTKAFYEEARTHLLLDKELGAGYPVRLIQGRQDRDVPWQTAAAIRQVFDDGAAEIIFIEDGDHRLSRPEDLERIDREIRALSSL